MKRFFAPIKRIMVMNRLCFFSSPISSFTHARAPLDAHIHRQPTIETKAKQQQRKNWFAWHEKVATKQYLILWNRFFSALKFVRCLLGRLYQYASVVVFYFRIYKVLWIASCRKAFCTRFPISLPFSLSREYRDSRAYGALSCVIYLIFVCSGELYRRKKYESYRSVLHSESHLHTLACKTVKKRNNISFKLLSFH